MYKLHIPSANDIMSYLDENDSQFVDAEAVNTLVSTFTQKTIAKLNMFQQEYPQHAAQEVTVNAHEFAIRCISSPIDEFRPHMTPSELSAITLKHINNFSGSVAQTYRNAIARSVDDQFVQERAKVYKGDPSGKSNQFLLTVPPGLRKTTQTIKPESVTRKRLGKHAVHNYQSECEMFSSNLKQKHLDQINYEFDS